MPFHQVMVTLWALEDALLQNPLSDEEQDALINAVLKAIQTKN